MYLDEIELLTAKERQSTVQAEDTANQQRKMLLELERLQSRDGQRIKDIEFLQSNESRLRVVCFVGRLFRQAQLGFIMFLCRDINTDAVESNGLCPRL